MKSTSTTFEQNYTIGRHIIEQAPQLYVDVDIEADGWPGYGSMLSIGAITPLGDTFYKEMKPVSTLWVPGQKEFCEQHGLERERLKEEGEHPDIVMQDFTDWVSEQSAIAGKAGSVFSAFNASFDYPFVQQYMLHAGVKNPFGAAAFCTKSLAQALDIASFNWRNTTKSNLPPDIIPDGDFTHNALEDAVWQQKLHFALVGKLVLQNKA